MSVIYLLTVTTVTRVAPLAIEETHTFAFTCLDERQKVLDRCREDGWKVKTDILVATDANTALMVMGERMERVSRLVLRSEED